MGFKRVHVIVNPASGKDQPILHALNSVFHAAGIDWDIYVTKAGGDAQRLATEAVRRAQTPWRCMAAMAR